MTELLPHPGEILAPYFEKKKALRKKYSLRALARDVQLSPGMVSQVLAKRRNPSQEAIGAFAKALRIKGPDLLILKKSAILHGGRKNSAHRILADYIEQDATVLTFRKYKQSDLASLSLMTRWYHMALFELLTCDVPSADERTLQSYLGISLSEMREALGTLASAGLIERRNGRWEKKTLHIEFPEELTQATTRQYHRMMITRTLSIMAEQQRIEDVKRRRIVGVTVAVNPKNVPKAIEDLNRFLFKMTETLGTGPCSEVYQLNLQLVPLTKEKT